MTALWHILLKHSNLGLRLHGRALSYHMQDPELITGGKKSINKTHAVFRVLSNITSRILNLKIKKDHSRATYIVCDSCEREKKV